MSQFYNALWYLERWFLSINCFFVGHDERGGNQLYYEVDYCNRCLTYCPQDKTTLPLLLTRLYVWAVDREWRWFDRLDWWLCENHQNRLPHWWEY